MALNTHPKRTIETGLETVYTAVARTIDPAKLDLACVRLSEFLLGAQTHPKTRSLAQLLRLLLPEAHTIVTAGVVFRKLRSTKGFTELPEKLYFSVVAGTAVAVDQINIGRTSSIVNLTRHPVLTEVAVGAESVTVTSEDVINSSSQRFKLGVPGLLLETQTEGPESTAEYEECVKWLLGRISK